VHPHAPELPNGADDDCDEVVDEGTGDADRDGSPTDEDCDDADPWARPDGAEVCDLVDNDCDGEVDEGCADDARADVVDETCGCRSPAGPDSLGWVAVALAGAASRRRRREEAR
jgi:MYXO-CTERM domain-containing protein